MSSKIKVDTIENVAGSGNVSLGSGHNLVVPGTLAITGASTLTGVVTIDASNALSTASGANAKLNVGSLSGTAASLNVNVAGTDGAGAYRLINATDGVTTNFLVKTDNSGSENRLELGPETSSAIAFEIQGSEKMKINPAGQVTKPFQPAFKTGVVSRNATSSDRIISTNNGDAFNYQTRDKHNVGGHFSETTGRFTCPVAGTYVFYCSLMRHGTNGTILENRIKKNGGLMFARAYADGYTAAYQQSMLVTTSVCAVNDYIEFFIQGTSSIYQDDTYIGGYLLG